MQSSRSSSWPHRSGVCNFGRDWKVFLENTGSKVTHASQVSSLKPPYRSQFTLELRPQILRLGGVTDKISLFAVSSLLWCGTSSTFCIPPHERCTRRMLSPSILSSSLSLVWVMWYWNHMPSWIPRGSSHLIRSQQPCAGCGHSAVAKGGLPASCVGSKYLHSLLSRVARRRGLWCFGLCKVQSSRMHT